MTGSNSLTERSFHGNSRRRLQDERCRKLFALLCWFVATPVLTWLASCGGSGSSGSSPGQTQPTTYTIGGTIAGLSGSGLVLQDNKGNNLSVAAGATNFTFATGLASGGSYSVTVFSQPSNPAQTCTVADGSGAVASANVTSVQVACTTPSYTIGGVITGLTSSGMVLQDNSGNNLSVAAGASSFTFSTQLVSGSSYNVTVLTQPSSPAQTCSVTNGTGTVGSANITSVQVGCSASSTLSFSQAPNLGTYSVGDVEIPLLASGGTGSYKWSIASGSLPPGMAVRTDGASWFPANATAGLIGIATISGSYQFTVQVTDGIHTATQNDTIQITSLCVQDLYNIPDAFVNTSYSYTLTALNNAGPVTWTATAGLPPGMSLSSAGVLSGTATATGTYNINFTLSDGASTVNRGVTLNIYAIKFTTSAVLPNAAQNQAYTTTVHAAGGSGSYAFTASGLPSGLSMSSAGVISGTPSASLGRSKVTVSATDAKGLSYSESMSLDVLGSQPTLASVEPYSPLGQYLNDCTIGVPCGQGINAANGGVAPFTWSASGLPPGMTIHWPGAGPTDEWVTPGDGEIWGTPTSAGTYNVQLTVTDATGARSMNTFPLRISVLELTTYLSNGTISSPYSQTLRIIGGSGSYSAQASGHLPAGIEFNSSNLTLSGTPAESGTCCNIFAIFQISDSANDSLLMTDYLSVASGGSGGVQIGSYYDLGPSWATGTQYSDQLSACCASGYVWSMTAGTLPPGLTLSTSGLLSGTLTTAGKYLFSIKVEDSSNSTNYAIEQFSLDVTPIAIAYQYDLPYGDLSVPISDQLAATGTTGTLTWTLLPKFYLPTGLTLASNGTIAGTPTEPGQFIVEANATDSLGNTAPFYFDISIYPSQDYTVSSVTVSCANAAIVPSAADQCTASVNGSGDYSGYVNWSASAGTISNSGLFTAPSSPAAVTVTATSGANSSVFGSTTVTVAPPNPVPSISSLSPSSAAVGAAGFTLTVNGSNFAAGSIIQWNGNTRATTYISSTQLSTTITSADLAIAQNASITVVNPAPGGGPSADASFPVTASAPGSISLLPSSAAAGGAGFTLTVNGTNFLPGSTVQWNGSYGQPPLTTTYVSSTEVTVAIPANDIAFAGNANVTVVNPSPGGGTSAAAVFTIAGSIPSNVSFVAPTGNDNNVGTITQPYLTIQKCASTVANGDICAIRAGTYRETVTPNSGITITSYDGEP